MKTKELQSIWSHKTLSRSCSYDSRISAIQLYFNWTKSTFKQNHVNHYLAHFYYHDPSRINLVTRYAHFVLVAQRGVCVTLKDMVTGVKMTVFESWWSRSSRDTQQGYVVSYFCKLLHKIEGMKIIKQQLNTQVWMIKCLCKSFSLLFDCFIYNQNTHLSLFQFIDAWEIN